MTVRTSLIAASVCIFLSAPAFAGNLTYSDNRGVWAATHCMKPQVPGKLSSNSEERANNLNAQIQERNTFVAAAQQYMECIKKEAEQDATAASYLVTQTAQKMIAEMQQEIMQTSVPMTSGQTADK